MARTSILYSDISKRPSNTKEVNTRYFFALEGEQTEKIYLEALLKYYNKENLTAFNYYRESSNVSKIIDEVQEIIEGSKKISITYKDLSKKLYLALLEGLDFFTKKEDEVESLITRYLSKSRKKIEDEVDMNEISNLLAKIDKSKLLGNVYDVINEDEFIKKIERENVFDPEIDSIIVVGDRDRGSFTEEQYDHVLDVIKTKKITLIMTNPCIEFWFLLHHTDCKEGIEMSDWNSINNAGSKVYNELKKFDPRYTKRNIDTDLYIALTDTAVEHAKYYPSDIKMLKDNVGTNFETLIKMIKRWT